MGQLFRSRRKIEIVIQFSVIEYLGSECGIEVFFPVNDSNFHFSAIPFILVLF